jgi:YesN/AraC family two-component response regulator
MEKSLAAETVLIVDDEESIINAMRRELMDEEYRCLFAQSGNQALKIIQKEDVSVIISDMKMPEMDGLRLLKVVKEKHPAIARVVLSGYTQLPQILITINQAEVFKFLTKPWGTELKSVIVEAIRYHQLQEDREKIQQLLNIQFGETTSIIDKIESVVTAANNSSVLFAAMGIKALEIAAEALESQSNRQMTKEQLLLAASLLSALARTDFEEYRDLRVSVFCADLAQILSAQDNIKTVETERTSVLLETVKTRHNILIRFLATAVKALTDFPQSFSIKLKPRLSEAELLAKFELTCVISDLGSRQLQQEAIDDQQAYVDMLNVFATKVLTLLNGDFHGVIVNGVIILKVVVNDYRDRILKSE